MQLLKHDTQKSETERKESKTSLWNERNSRELMLKVILIYAFMNIFYALAIKLESLAEVERFSLSQHKSFCSQLMPHMFSFVSIACISFLFFECISVSHVRIFHSQRPAFFISRKILNLKFFEDNVLFVVAFLSFNK